MSDPPGLSIEVLVRGLWPGSFTRFAIEEVAHLNRLQSTSARLVAFGIYDRGYHFEDLAEARGVQANISALPPLVDRLSRRILILFTPRIRGQESVVPIHNIVVWGIVGRGGCNVVYGEDQFVGFGCWIRWVLHGTPYVLCIAEPVSDLAGIRNLRVGRMRLLNRPIAAIARFIEETILSNASALLFVSNRTLSAIKTRFPALNESRMSILTPGCEPNPPRSRENQGRRFLLAVSKWDSGRNPGFAIELARRLKIEVVLAGSWIDGGTQMEFNAAVDRAFVGEPRLLEVTGRVSQTQLDNLIPQAYAYVHWNEEGFGLGVLEAMSNGIPVICTALAGASELLAEGGGVVVQDSGHEAFLRAVESFLLDPSSRDRMSKEAYQIAQKHSWHNHCLALRGILENSIGT